MDGGGGGAGRIVYSIVWDILQDQSAIRLIHKLQYKIG